MAIQFSTIASATTRGNGDGFQVKAIDLESLGEHAWPVIVLDDFRVSSHPFPPHPHAGFSAVTYVFEDSPGSLRSRDSLGNDTVIGPGGIVWTQAGSGMLHHEIPADRHFELHGLQLFVNLSAKNKLIAPQMLRLKPEEVPVWSGKAGDKVRVLVGSYQGITSPLVPAEPFTFLEVVIQRGLTFDVPLGHKAISYVLDGPVTFSADGNERVVKSGQAIGLFGSGGPVAIHSYRPVRFVILSGPELREPVEAQGGFIMNDRRQIESALVRYRSGQMGELAPLPGDRQ